MSEEKKQTESYPSICPECGTPLPTFGLCTCMNEDDVYWDEDCGYDFDDDEEYFDDELM